MVRERPPLPGGFFPIMRNYADCINFVNADLIAAGLSPFLPDIAAIKAGKIMLDQILSSLQTVARFMDAIR